MKYICLKTNEYFIDNYFITPFREEDIFLIKKWRNEQLNILRQNKLLSDEEQKSYYENVIKPTFTQSNPKIILFSYLQDNECIGYGGLTNLDWISKRAELSFLLKTMRSYNNKMYEKDFSIYLKLIKSVAFEEINLNRLFTETFDIRPLHIKVLEKNGFELEGRLRQNVYIEGLFVDSLIHGLLRERYYAER